MTTNNRYKLKQAKRWVVKIGSALLTANGQGLDQQAMRSWWRNGCVNTTRH